jgi:hypothetical protein
VIYKPTQEMLADIMTKTLTGNLFKRLRDHILEYSLPPNILLPALIPIAILLLIPKPFY